MSTATPNIELISFDLCPFVQRSVITLLEKDIPFRRVNIDLTNKPDWFLRLSPLGKVPVLKIHGQVLFESAVINEYLDEINPPSMPPADPLQKALNRAWIEYSAELSNLSFTMATTEDEEALARSLASLRERFRHLEKNLGEGPFFNGESFSLIDAAYAPVFIRIAHLLELATAAVIPPECRKTLNWRDAILARESVRGSVIEDFTRLAIERFQRRGSVLLKDL